MIQVEFFSLLYSRFVIGFKAIIFELNQKFKMRDENNLIDSLYQIRKYIDYIGLILENIINILKYIILIHKR